MPISDLEKASSADVIRAYWTAIAESSGDAIVGKTLEGIITAWNRGAERLYGYTAQKQVEQMKDEFMATVSHELRTPLSSIKIMVDNLKERFMGALNTQQQECVEIIANNVDRLAHMINNLLDLSKLESGIIDVHIRQLSLNTLITDCLTTFKPIAQERVVSLKSHLATQADTVFADPDLMSEVIHNLLDNGIRFTKSDVVISTRLNGNKVEIMVSDNGIGIHQEDIKRLFNKFEQVNRQHGGRGYKGTGLGLAICKQIVDLHHGRIWVESAPGTGSTFHVEIPQRADGG